ncbi:methyltransferase [Rhodococcus sp. 27YEA15]|uniref:methyltransferase n=1 Tax=Rhodococcus sp. 27YEA15 TaxID=3156259 RepID=UPI003C7B7CF1
MDAYSAIGRAELAFADLLETIVTGKPAYPRRYGVDFWTDLEANPNLQESFDAKMSRRFQIQARQIAQRFDWSRFGSVVDVGGGDGTLLSAILSDHPSVRGAVLDLPPTAQRARMRFGREGLTSRAETIPGSFFDPLPANADAYLLSDVLHDWGDEESRSILRRCAQAAGSDGRVLVVEALRTNAHDLVANTALDLFMLMCFGGRERTSGELRELATDCGLVLLSIGPVADRRTLIEFGVSAS